MPRGSILALDLGTTGVRALVVGPDGRVRGRAYRKLASSFPRPGWVEQDPVEMWVLGVAVMREALAAAGVGAAGLGALGVVTQRATALAWDARTGQPLAPAIGWQDQRTAGRVAELRAAGIPINTLVTAAKLEWCMRHLPEVRRAAGEGRLRLGTPDAWLTYQLTGERAHDTDPGHASCTGLYDLGGDAWAPPLCELFGVPIEALPRITASAAVAGETPRELLGAPVPVAARVGDQQASAFGQGVHERGQAKLTIGTSAMLDRHAGDEVPPFESGAFPLVLWKFPDGTREFCREGTVIAAGAAVDWLVALGLAADAAEVDQLAREAGSSDGVVFVPALQGLGTPFLDDAARGLIGGLTRGSGRTQLARATFEGIAHRCADLVEALDAGREPLRVDGGLARSDLQVQLIADCAGVDVLRAAEAETTAFGAAQLAGLAVGAWGSPAECRAALPAARRFGPRLPADERGRARHAWSRAVERARGGDAAGMG